MPTNVSILPASDDPAALARAAELARQLGLSLPEEAASGRAPDFRLKPLPNGRGSEAGGLLPHSDVHRDGSDTADLILAVTASRLELRDSRSPRSRPVYVDFVSGPTAARQLSSSRKQPLARAVGIRGNAPSVLDATAGLCRDAFQLAALGCRVLAVERSAVLFALAEDGLDRARAPGVARVQSIVERIRLVHADARHLRANAPNSTTPVGSDDELILAPDVVYLDPMYLTSQATAAVKKEMRILRELVGDDSDASGLLEWARSLATKRVAVKRMRHSPPLAPNPSHSIVGTRVRYDVYMI